MKLNKSKIHWFYILAFFIMPGSACKKFVEIPSPKNNIITQAVFSDSLTATSAVLGIYTQIMSSSSLLNSDITAYTGLYADELNYTVTGYQFENIFFVNGLTPSIGMIGSWWQEAYYSIYQANACIEGIAASSALSASLKNQLTGEAKFMRAIFYFNLVNLYGAVPLVTSTDYKTNETLPRANEDSIYQQIIADLTEARSLLSEDYATSQKVRPNKWSATALLARVYLYQDRWSDAEAIATQVIASGKYSLVDLNNVFLAGSDEAILQFIPSDHSTETTEGSIFLRIDQDVIPAYIINSALLSQFETGDQRFTSWLNSTTVNGEVYYYPYKYKIYNGGQIPPSEYYMIFRLAEQYLIRAEARAQLEKLSDATTDLDKVRARAGLPGYAGPGVKDSLLSAILHERQIELFCELGHRWYDLKRTGNADLVMSQITPAKGGEWQDFKKLFPIPIGQIQTNPFLTQNTGY